MGIPLLLKMFWTSFLNMFSKTYTARVCGHMTKRRGLVFKERQVRITTMPVTKEGVVDYCIACIEKKATSCTRCRGPIFIGDLVSMGHYTVEGMEDVRQALHCDGCVDTIADLNGWWAPPGVVEGFPSALEEAYRTGKATHAELS